MYTAVSVFYSANGDYSQHRSVALALASSASKREKLTQHYVLFIFYLNINQLDALNFYNELISCLYMFQAPCVNRQEVKIVQYYTASGIITPIDGRPVHRLHLLAWSRWREVAAQYRRL